MPAQQVVNGKFEYFGTSIPAESTTGNVVLGESAGETLAAKSEANVCIGTAAGATASTCTFNTFVGNGAGREVTTGGGNVCVGAGAGKGLTAGTKNVFIGGNAGVENTGKSNIFIGYEAGEKTTGENKLIIANNSTTPLIEGVLSGTQKLGFYGVTPVTRAAEIKVPGTFKTGISAFETEAECKAIRDKQAAIIEALKGIGICV